MVNYFINWTGGIKLCLCNSVIGNSESERLMFCLNGGKSTPAVKKGNVTKSRFCNMVFCRSFYIGVLGAREKISKRQHCGEEELSCLHGEEGDERLSDGWSKSV